MKSLLLGNQPKSHPTAKRTVNLKDADGVMDTPAVLLRKNDVTISSCLMITAGSAAPVSSDAWEVRTVLQAAPAGK